MGEGARERVALDDFQFLPSFTSSCVHSLVRSLARSLAIFPERESFEFSVPPS